MQPFPARWRYASLGVRSNSVHLLPMMAAVHDESLANAQNLRRGSLVFSNRSVSTHSFPGLRVQGIRRGVVVGTTQEEFDVSESQMAFIDGLKALPGGQIRHGTHGIPYCLLARLEQPLIVFSDQNGMGS